MKRALQNLLLLVYRAVAWTGALSTRPGRRVFYLAYGLYKRHLEAGDLRPLQRLIPAGTSIVDVGANIGEVTLELARWVSDGGRVYAFEPEPANFRQLTERLEDAGLTDRVEAVRAAVADTRGELQLLINTHHPGDHHLGERGLAVPAVTLDSYLAERGEPPVSLIKIDVQGAELRVLGGAHRTLERWRPALLLEVDGEHLKRFAASPRQLLETTTGYGYEICRLRRGGVSEPLDLEEALAQQAAAGYLDFLLLPVGPSNDLPKELLYPEGVPLPLKR